MAAAMPRSRRRSGTRCASGSGYPLPEKGESPREVKEEFIWLI